MLKNYLRSAYRNLLKYKLFFALNIAGLGISVACALLLLVYVFSEFTYESQHQHLDSIYRIAVTTQVDDNIVEFAPNVPALAPALSAAIPEITHYVRIKKDWFNISIKYGENSVDAENVYTVDSSFFSVFSYAFVRGGGNNALSQPNSLVLTKALAGSLFGSGDPIGKPVTVGQGHYIVSGVLDTPPVNSHLKFDVLIPWSAFPPDEGWDDAHAYTYLRVDTKHNPDLLQSKIRTFIDGNEDVQAIEAKLNAKVTMALQPLEDIHLHSNRHNELSQNGNPVMLYVFISIAVFFLLLSGINYVNMAVANSLNRSREIGVRKVLGAASHQIRIQYLLESFVTILLAFGVGVVLTVCCLDHFARLVGEPLDFSVLLQPQLLLLVFLLITGHTLLSGSYPAFYISAFSPANIFHTGGGNPGDGSLSLRKILLVLQLSISAVVVTATVIVMAQLNYIKQADLGFNKDNVMILSVPGGNQSEYFLQTLEKQPFVKKVAVSDYFPGASYKDEHLIEMKNGEMKTRTVQRMFIDHHFVDLLNLKMVAGRNFNTRFETDFREAFLVNETAAKAFGWREPVGKKIEAISYGKKGVVIGVVNDANLFSLHKKIEPIVIQLSARNAGEGSVAYVKLGAPAKSAYISRIQAIHKQAFGQAEFGYSFLDDRYRNLYKSDEKLGQVLLISSIIILLISCSGLFALSSFIAVQRAREMGIRKIMGASDRQIFLLYIKNFTILAVIANLVAWPLAHFMMVRWLEDFTFRTDVSFGFHLLAVAVTMVIVEVTVGIHALKLARLNLINILKM